ncbi:MAG: hypothetical protein QOE31_1758 [Solirubrobacteraceae bacterium]|jgi:hypothetical protein|nr:hypothetical protein [Solirubrobacteraceae bacterium]
MPGNPSNIGAATLMPGALVENLRMHLTTQEAMLIDVVALARRVGESASLHAGAASGRGGYDPRAAVLAGFDGHDVELGGAVERSVRDGLAAAVREARAAQRPWREELVSALIALGPDARVPAHPRLAAAWRVIVGALADALPSRVLPLTRPLLVDDDMLERLRKDALEVWRDGDGTLSQRPGRTGCRLAVSNSVLASVGASLGYPVTSGLRANYLFYRTPSELMAPHIDTDEYDVTMILMLSRRRPADGSAGSALLTYRPDGSVQRIQLEPGDAVLVERGHVHAREPLKPGEQLTLLTLAFRAPQA